MSEPLPRIDFSQAGWHGLCPRWQALKLDGWLRYWLTSHFIDPNNIWEPDIRNRVWSDTDQTQIQIETIARWKPTLTEKRPGLIIKRHAMTPIKQGIGGDRLQGARRKLYSSLFTGSTTTFCISREPGECDLLASEVWHELLQFAQEVRKKLNLVRVALAGIGELSKLEESSESFVCPVTLGYAFWDSYEIMAEDASPLARINLDI